MGVLALEIDTSTASFLDRAGEEWATYQRSAEQFGGDEFIAVAIRGERPFDRELLQDVVRLSGEVARVEGVRRVDSLATVNNLRRGADGSLRLDPVLSGGVPRSDQELRALREAVRSDFMAPGSLVSADEKTFALNVMLDENVDANRAHTVEQVRKLLGPLPTWMSGVPVFRTAVNSRTKTEVLLFTPLTVLVLGLVFGLALRSPVVVLMPLLMGAIGSAAALGAMGATGTPLSLSTLLLPSVLLALGCAYATHMVLAGGQNGSGHMAESSTNLVRPVALSGLTTAIGFLAMATVNIAAIRELATFGAIGVLILTAAVLTLLPALLSMIRPVALDGGALAWARGPLSSRLSALVGGWSDALIVLWIAMLVLVGVGVANLRVSTDIILWFTRDSAIRSDYEEIRRSFAGITPVNVVIRSTEGAPVTAPAAVAAIDALAAELRSLPIVGQAISVADPLARMHQLVTESDERVIPKDEATIEQYLLFLEGESSIRDVLSSDHRAANVKLRIDDNSSDEIVALGDWVDAWWSRFGPRGYEAETTGIMYEFGRAEEEIAYGQLRGLGLAFASIAAVLLLMLRRIKMALIALLPNAIPLGMAFGFMGIIEVPLDAATVCLGSLALGIAVDDSIHLMTRFGEAQGDGDSPKEAIQTAFRRVLPALVLSSVAIAVGFAVLAVSDFTLVRNLGLITAGLVLLCLLADATLLPALLLRASPREAPADQQDSISHPALK